jgi:hypothetical protein
VIRSLNAKLHFHVSVADGSSNAAGRETIDFVSCSSASCFDGILIFLVDLLFRRGNFEMGAGTEEVNIVIKLPSFFLISVFYARIACASVPRYIGFKHLETYSSKLCFSFFRRKSEMLESILTIFQ